MTRTVVNRYPTGSGSVLLTGIVGNTTGSNQSIDTPVVFDPSTTDWTINLWLYPTATGVDMSYGMNIYSQNDGTGTGRTWLSSQLGNGNYTSTVITGGGQTDFGVQPIKNAWQMVTMVYTLSTTTMKFYFNGSLASTTAAFPIQSATGTHRIGASKGAAGTRCFNGNIGPVMVFTRAILDAELATIYSSNAFTATNQALYYPMLQASGDVQDFSGNANNGTLINSAAWSAITKWPVRSTASRAQLATRAIV